MKGLHLLLHSIRQVVGNLDAALKISALPYVIQWLAGLILLHSASGMAQGRIPGGGMMAGWGLAGLLFLLVMLGTSVWIAVAWHRCILLNEAPSGFVPPIHQDRMLGYVLRALGYGILVMLIAMVLGLVVGGLFGGLLMHGRLGLYMIVTALLIQLPMAIIGFRFSTGLPAAALDQGTDFMVGWQATTGATIDIAVLAVLAVLANLILGFIDLHLFGGLPLLSHVWGLIAGWLVTMVGISILTTLYGHYVEKRPLV